MVRYLFLIGSLLALQTAEGVRVVRPVSEDTNEKGSHAVVERHQQEPEEEVPDEEICSAVIHRRRNLQMVQLPVAVLFAGAWVAGGHYIFTAGELVISALLPASSGTVPGWLAGVYEVWYNSALVLDGVESVAVGLAGSDSMISRYEQANGNASEIGNATRADGFIAYGSHRPRCCCRAGSEGEDCQVLPAVSGSPDCPEGMERTPGMCNIQEVINFEPNQTVHGCRCLNITNCGRNSPFKGHSWCEVDASDGQHCGTRYTGNYGAKARRWDLCMMTGAPLRAMLGFDSATRNDFLAAFIPNEYAGEGHSVLPSASQVISRYDTVAYRDSWTSSTECFIGHPSETLSACAERCLEEGAQGYHRNGTLVKSRHTHDSSEPDACVAFAYSPSNKQCVVLPERAQDSKFTPLVTDWIHPRGWQHFTLKSHLRCPRGAVFDMVKNFEIAHSNVDRFVHLKCKDDQSGTTYKASCDEHECDGAPWCFVPESCAHHSSRHRCTAVPPPECSASDGGDAAQK